MSSLYTLNEGTAPLIINVPHAGTYVPPDILADLTPIAQTLADTDWHVPLLYEFALAAGATLMAATHSRYVIDLNRDPGNAALYPGADNTELCPTRSFHNEDLYLTKRAPSEDAIKQRREQYWTPYHAELARQIARVKQQHGYALLLDAHSIASVLPRFFDGRLPDLNLGTADGASCDAGLQNTAWQVLNGSEHFSSIVNGRFKGGYITRHYGRPGEQLYALQLEITQRAYMDEGAPYAWNPTQAVLLIEVLKRLVETLLTCVSRRSDNDLHRSETSIDGRLAPLATAPESAQ
ncbi:MAG: N-formylglutamate deformylase [Hydrocarboniphaga sp.]|uniref:N-formylglutamate deformylase n=1 Tax=Hydrocarboniphaga sp. TaxID=2033016 RepID=UPI0026308D1A|nr:N-formylglutamate deformylase [Hydrocarboniphaga sp.]MDB5969046.1 N-formylglutamate deformylase [Hydrocarboniphaga sp.]